MAKTKHRVLSLLLSLAMVLTLLPANALAEEVEGMLPQDETRQVSASELYALLDSGAGEEECVTTLGDVQTTVQEKLGATSVYLELEDEDRTKVTNGDAVIHVTKDSIKLVPDGETQQPVESDPEGDTDSSEEAGALQEPALMEVPGLEEPGPGYGFQDDQGDDEDEDVVNGTSDLEPTLTPATLWAVYPATNGIQLYDRGNNGGSNGGGNNTKSVKIRLYSDSIGLVSGQEATVTLGNKTYTGKIGFNDNFDLQIDYFYVSVNLPKNADVSDATVTYNGYTSRVGYDRTWNYHYANDWKKIDVDQGDANSVYLFIALPSNTSYGTDGDKYRFLTYGGSVNSLASTSIAVIDTSTESNITKYVATWPTDLKTNIENTSSDPVGAGSTWTISSSTGEVTNFKLYIDGKWYSNSAQDSTDHDSYSIRWVKFSYALTGDHGSKYHVDGALFKNVTVNNALEGAEKIAVSLPSGVAETFEFTLAAVDQNGNEITGSDFSPVTLTATVSQTGTAGAADITVQNTNDGYKVLNPGRYRIQENGAGWKSEPIYFSVTTDGTVTWENDKSTITNKPDGTDITVEVYLDGETHQVKASDYITVASLSGTTDFSASASGNDILVDYSYEQHDCADFQISLNGSNYVLQGVTATVIGGSSGARQITVTDGSTISLDNVQGGSTVKVYLNTPYTVEYDATGEAYTDSNTYIVSAAVSTTTDSSEYPTDSDQTGTNVSWHNGNLKAAIDLPALPTADPGQTVTGWYTSSDKTGTPYQPVDGTNDVNVSQVYTTAGSDHVIHFYHQTSQNIYTVTYKPGDHGSLGGADNDGNVVHSDLAHGTTTPAAPAVTVTDDDYYFTGWSPAVDTTVTHDAEYTAQYAPKTPLTVTIADRELTYNGAEQSGWGYVVSGDGQTAVTGDLADGHTIMVANYTPAKGTNAGTYTNGTNNPTITVKDSAGMDVTKQYKITFTPGTLTITPKTITASDLSFTAKNKQYDGNTEAMGSITFTQESGITGVTVNAGSKTFSDKNVETDKTVTARGLSLSGDNAVNYQLADDITLTDTANITPAKLNVTVNFTNRDYVAGITSVDVKDVTITSGLIEGDVVTVTASGTGTMDDAYVGTNKTVSNTSAVTVTASGNDAKNYTLNKAYGKVTIYGKVTYAPNADGDTVANMPADNNQYEYDAPVTASTAVPSPARDNYTFVGWALTPTATANECVETAKMGTTGITFYAVWSRDTYQVTVQYQYSDDKQTFTDYSYTDGQTNPFTVNAGDSWTIGISGDSTPNPNYTAPATLTVNGKTYVYDAYATNNDLAGNATETVTLKYGLDEKGKVTEDGDTTGDDTPDYYQVFLEFEADEGGTITNGESKTITFADGAISGTISLPVTVSAAPEGKHVFVDWSNSQNDSRGSSYLLAQNDFALGTVPGGTTIIFTANFDPYYTLTFDANGGTFKDQNKTYTRADHYAGNAKNVPLHSSSNPAVTGPSDGLANSVLIGWTLDPSVVGEVYARGEYSKLPQTMETVSFNNKDITVYAVWGWDTNDNDQADVLENDYSLTFKANGGRFDVIGSGKTYTRDEKYLEKEYASLISESDPDLIAPAENVMLLGWTRESTGAHIGHIYSKDDTTTQPTYVDGVIFGTKDETVYAVWAYDVNDNEMPDVNETAYGVRYDWGTVVPAGVTLPTNTNTYLVGMPVAVDSAYSNATTVPGTVNGVPGTWHFSGWHLGDALVTPESSVAMREDGLTFTGKWEFVEQGKATVSYSWTGNVPAGVVLPASVEDYEGFSHSVDTTFYAGRTIVTADGVYTFSGWNQRGTITVNTNTVITGTWSFTPYNRSVSVTKSCGISTAEVDDVITYTIRVTNTGDVDLSDVTITDTFTGAGSLTFSGADGVTTNGNGTYTITIDDLPSQRTVSITATYTVVAADAGTTITNTAVSALDTDDTDDSTVVTVEPVDPDPDPTPDPEPDDPRPDRPNRPNRPSTDNDDTTDIVDEEVPLAELPGLNTVDHFAYITGYEDGTVRPEGYISRAEVATIFFRLMTDEYRETYWATSNLFTDVAQANWYNNGVSTTANVGWIAGYPDSTYRPNNNITRAEFATIASRFLSGDYNGENMFTDIEGHWAADYINRAAAIGWITGYAGQFRPDDYITRAEAVTLINRMLDRAPDADHMLENMIRWPDNPETAWYYEAIQEATNSHDYDRETIIDFETWTELLPNRDWAALEEVWAQAGDAAGGEVADGLFPDGNDNN